MSTYKLWPLALILTFSLSGCATRVNDGKWLDVEWGGSQVVTTEVAQRVTTHPDGRVVTETGVVEETATANGLSENVRGLVAAIIGFLIGAS